MSSRRSSGAPPSGTKQRDDLFDNAESKLRYEAYSRLQAAAVAFGDSCTLTIPEIVAIGGQSDGKSSLLEAFLGFRFNVREVEMGTRRPLIVQMVHDPTALEPRCRLQEEDSEEYGPPIVPESAVADAIMQCTKDHLRKLGGAAVSAKPICMRAEYAYCPNLTIIDTPGFILKAKNGEADSTPDEIMKMVKAQAAPRHRLILFLQQSSVEWASSLWLRVVQEVDPQFQRTVIVASKFDNRLKEFGERWEVDRYLSATGYLPPGVKPFFVALPKDRAAQGSAEWRRAMAEVDAGVFAHLREGIKGGFDEAQYGPRVGFGNLKRFLEDELARRYRDAAPATLALLTERCEALGRDLAALEARLAACADVAALRRAGLRHAAAVSSQVLSILNGSTEPDPAQHGMTTEEERAAARSPQWPGVRKATKPPNAGLKLFGGAAFERCLHEFQEAAAGLAFPSSAVARDRVANVLLAYKGRSNVGGGARAAEDIARATARELLGPLLDAVCARLGFVLRRVFEIAADSAMVPPGPGREALAPYVAFHAALRSAHASFAARLEGEARRLLAHHLDAATSEFALALMAPGPGQAPTPVPQPVPTWGAAGDGPEGDAENQEPSGDDDLPMAQARTPIGRSQLTTATVPETPSPDMAAAQQQQQGCWAKEAAAAAAGRRALAPVGPGHHVDNTPSKGRATKAQKRAGGAEDDKQQLQQTAAALSGLALCEGRGSYADVVGYAERLFGRIRMAVACQAAPATLKAAFLDPVREQLATEVAVDLFGRSDGDYMSMFTAAGALAALTAKRDGLARRLDGLSKCKLEFQELSKCL